MSRFSPRLSLRLSTGNYLKPSFGGYSSPAPQSGTNSSAQPATGSSGIGPSSNTMDLPSSYGVHLTPGLDRKPGGAAPGRYDPGEPTLKMQLVRWENKKMPFAYLSQPRH